MIKRITLLLSLSVLCLYMFSSVVSAQNSSGRMYFESTEISTTNGSEFTTNIYVDTAGASSGGAGAIIIYNPVFLEAVSITPGIIYDDYPLSVIDNTNGKVLVSGISGSKNQLFSGDDIFATITWRSKSTGVTDINFDFEQGSTTDSNIAVTFGNGDILSSVNSLDVSISASSGNASATATPAATQVASNTYQRSGSFFNRALDTISRILGRDPQSIDPYDPIYRTDPITELNENGEEIAFESRAQGPSLFIIAGIVGALLIIVLIVIVILKRRKKDQGVVVNEYMNPQNQGSNTPTPKV